MPHSPLNSIFDLPRWQKQLLMVITDTIIITLSIWLAFALNSSSLSPSFNQASILFILLPLISIPLFFKMGLYQSVIRYIGAHTIVAILIAISLATLSAFFVLFISQSTHPISISLYIIYWVVVILGISGSRYLIRQYYAHIQNYDSRINVAIFGAGKSGIQLAISLTTSSEYRPKAFIDERLQIKNQRVHGLKVFQTEAIDRLIKKYNIQQVLLAIPSASKERRREIVNSLTKYPVHVKTVPDINDIILGRSRIDQLRELAVDELLGRTAVKPNPALMAHCITHKSVMVTGAGGSIGSELCRQIVSMKPTCLVLYELTEFALYQIEQELTNHINDHTFNIQIIPTLGSVYDQDHVTMVMKHYQVNTLYHAAAYKHVPLVEENPIDGIKNNVLGTYHTALAAIQAEVENFVLISTDKAVRPTNVMGATKRLAEMVLQGLNQLPHQTCFSMVRFGNVLGSSGSVIPLFKQQIAKGGPITLTHEEMTRYFMTIPEASQLVIQAGAMGTGGDVFILDMGDSVRIQDLAERMVYLSNLTLKTEHNPYGDIALAITGLRSGEKLYEELLIDSTAEQTQHTRILRATEQYLSWHKMEKVLQQIEMHCQQRELTELLTLLVQYVEGYQCQHPAYTAPIKANHSKN